MTNEFDVAVIGLGAMGSASVLQLAKRGLRTVGLDRLHPPHTFGSTHGETRITRQAIGEGASYVPMALRSHAIWKEIERQTGRKLLHEVGALTISRADNKLDSPRRSGFLNQSLEAAKQFGIAHELLDADSVTKRFAQFTPNVSEMGFYEPGGGYLLVEDCVAANLELARLAGADLKLGVEVGGFDSTSNGFCIGTSGGRINAEKLVVSAGPWAGGLLGEPFNTLLTPTRQVMHWFELEPGFREQWRDSPVIMWMHSEGPKGFFYGFPTRNGTSMKCADEGNGERILPDEVERQVSPAESAFMFERHLEGRVRGVTDVAERSVTCMYTETADGQFLIDWHPKIENVLVVSPCSGHGFKHSAAIGEIVAQQIALKSSTINIEPFNIAHRTDRMSA